MGKGLFLGVLAMILVSLFILTSSNALAEDRYNAMRVSVLNQDPYPAQPNSYVEVVFKVENTGNLEVKDFLIELLPQYPFTLDSSAVKDLGNIGIGQYDEKAIYVKYKVRVDKDAIDGENEISARYVYDTNKAWRNYVTYEFNITVEDTKTDFDIAIQDYSYKTNSLSLAISNIGDEDADSVTVVLPEQSNIVILGSDKNILGGIEANDYTIASFKITPNQDGPLVVKISYTDSIGVRREVEKAVVFKASSYVQKTNNNGTQNYTTLIYIAIGIVGIVIIFILFRILKKRRKK